MRSVPARIDAFDRRIVEAVASRRRTDLNALLIPVNYFGRAGLPWILAAGTTALQHPRNRRAAAGVAL